ncbi:MAG TPA: 2-C-methyl-D-erythritol 2,4-cyclodiphosphate synthase [Candidatus Acutalibacter stercorigallinarum]|nr:2-C-methyl-D-erythritol 2,4-cyclodiphosphate synthase [Candidatus Acutalibacter stercorigallinarum]
MEQAKFGAVLLAAGNSTRMGGSRSKVLEELGGRPALCRSLEVLDRCPLIGEICLVCREQDRGDMLPLTSGLATPVRVVSGGAQRQDSVEQGVKALTGPWEYVAIHDGARPLVTEEVLAAVCRDAMAYGAATAAVPSKDTCKLADEAGFVAATPARDRLWAVQTPQAFSLALYREALGKARAAGQSYTDDCQLIEAAGGKVKLTMGDYRNIKLTTPEDLLAARAYLGGEGGKKTVRIGYGYDVHRLVEGRKLILAGVEVPFEKGLLGHSDADVIAHAVADALLGAAALGDIGHLFPDTDPRYAGADSLKLLGEVCRLLREKGFSIGNIDATLLAQRPKIAPHISRMRENLAAACGIAVDQVSVKATTEERLGFTGREEGMAASAVCLLER